MDKKSLENVKSVTMTFANSEVKEYKSPTPIRVAELAELLVTYLRNSNAGSMQATLKDEYGNVRFTLAIAEYPDAKDGYLFTQAVKDVTEAISENRQFWVEVNCWTLKICPPTCASSNTYTTRPFAAVRPPSSPPPLLTTRTAPSKPVSTATS